MTAKQYFNESQRREMAPLTSNVVDLILRVIAISMGIASVVLLATHLVDVEHAIILLGIAIVAIALERLTEKSE